MNQPRLYGAGDPAMAERILELLKEVTWSDTTGQYRPAIREHLARMREAIETAAHTPGERRRLLHIVRAMETSHGA